MKKIFTAIVFLTVPFSVFGQAPMPVMPTMPAVAGTKFWIRTIDSEGNPKYLPASIKPVESPMLQKTGELHEGGEVYEYRVVAPSVIAEDRRPPVDPRMPDFEPIEPPRVPLLPVVPQFRTPDRTNPASVKQQNEALANLMKVGSGTITIGGRTTQIIQIKHPHPADPWRVALFGRDMNMIPVNSITPRPNIWDDINKNILQFEGPFVMPPQQAPAEPGSAALGGGEKAGGSTFADWQNWFNSWGSGTFQFSTDLARWGHWPVLHLRVASPTLFGFALNFNSPDPSTIQTDIARQRHGRSTFGIPGADLFIQYSDTNGDGVIDAFRFYKITPLGTLGQELTPEQFAQYGLNMGYWEIHPLAGIVLNPSQEPPLLIARCDPPKPDGSIACYGPDGKFVATAKSPEAKKIIETHKGPLMFYPGALMGHRFVPMIAPPPPTPPAKK